jgi:non-homologous end joining protein Ku
MGAGAAVLAYEVEFNREVTNNQALFWSDEHALTSLFNEIATGSKDQELAELKVKSQKRILEHYQWDQVTDQYETLIKKLYARKKSNKKKSKGSDNKGSEK